MVAFLYELASWTMQKNTRVVAVEKKKFHLYLREPPAGVDDVCDYMSPLAFRFLDKSCLLCSGPASS